MSPSQHVQWQQIIELVNRNQYHRAYQLAVLLNQELLTSQVQVPDEYETLLTCLTLIQRRRVLVDATIVLLSA